MHISPQTQKVKMSRSRTSLFSYITQSHIFISIFRFFLANVFAQASKSNEEDAQQTSSSNGNLNKLFSRPSHPRAFRSVRKAGVFEPIHMYQGASFYTNVTDLQFAGLIHRESDKGVIDERRSQSAELYTATTAQAYTNSNVLKCKAISSKPYAEFLLDEMIDDEADKLGIKNEDRDIFTTANPANDLGHVLRSPKTSAGAFFTDHYYRDCNFQNPETSEGCVMMKEFDFYNTKLAPADFFEQFVVILSHALVELNLDRPKNVFKRAEFVEVVQNKSPNHFGSNRHLSLNAVLDQVFAHVGQRAEEYGFFGVDYARAFLMERGEAESEKRTANSFKAIRKKRLLLSAAEDTNDSIADNSENYAFCDFYATILIRIFLAHEHLGRVFYKANEYNGMANNLRPNYDIRKVLEHFSLDNLSEVERTCNNGDTDRDSENLENNSKSDIKSKRTSKRTLEETCQRALEEAYIKQYLSKYISAKNITVAKHPNNIDCPIEMKLCPKYKVSEQNFHYDKFKDDFLVLNHFDQKKSKKLSEISSADNDSNLLNDPLVYLSLILFLRQIQVFHALEDQLQAEALEKEKATMSYVKRYDTEAEHKLKKRKIDSKKKNLKEALKEEKAVTLLNVLNDPL